MYVTWDGDTKFTLNATNNNDNGIIFETKHMNTNANGCPLVVVLVVASSTCETTTTKLYNKETDARVDGFDIG
jgi:hypothetical protein